MALTRLAAILVLSLPALAAGGAEESFAGVISDDMCALNHASMRMGPTDAECAHACVDEHDAAYVLVDDGKVYRLSDQAASKKFAGQKVKVVGTLDRATNTITIASIAGA
jgi:hypothetical protein